MKYFSSSRCAPEPERWVTGIDKARLRKNVLTVSAILILVVVMVNGGALAILRFFFVPPYQVEIVNKTASTFENVVLLSERGETMHLGDIEPGVIRKYQPEFGEDSIYLTHRLGEMRFETRHYYFAWEDIFQFDFTDAGYARVGNRLYPWELRMSYHQQCVLGVKNESEGNIEHVQMWGQDSDRMALTSPIRPGESYYWTETSFDASKPALFGMWFMQDGRRYETKPAYISAMNESECMITWVVGKDGIAEAPRVKMLDAMD